eukprot:CAMPEP_0183296264 /NCGR_PEP_ID=MMETSP0160_2-20130417/3896_1 /TAXON_ID=2839 ORGANISM="Odontella Sinensis, Strain Grunow 1884" /NCGR_SAMPLE_ID=MMETSP0160_2 /ASSEMBLY_ACC=CAM_ASM_000250 /LENGTH=183 /DNA_ID=CAMNT_0025457859 /DNA_START=408 /DNA_END=959 /DNA_ORIENTATION=-
MKRVDMNIPIATRSHFIHDASASFFSGNYQLQEHEYLDRQHRPSPKVFGYKRDDNGSSVLHGGKKARCFDTFPMKLHKILSLVEADGLSSVMSWVPGGKAFRLKKQRFSDEIAQKYFRMQRMPSFFRQLNIYSFKHATTDTGEKIYFHYLFIQDHPQLAQQMTRNVKTLKKPALESEKSEQAK